jgi:3-methylfumaryl-CoA hydratase
VKVELEDVALDAEVTSEISLEQARRLQATIRHPGPLVDGGAVPLLWQWISFLPTTATADLGADGHPRTSGPIAAFPRRMWVAGSTTVERPLRFGRAATRRTTVAGTREVDGRSGSFVLVELEHTYTQDGATALVERQTIAYRAPGDPVALPTPDGSEPDGASVRRHDTDERLLFRFSALTFNTHRIHYDREYARQAEGYPDLVVHGPLSAILLAGHLSDEYGDVGSFSFRAKAPLFVGQPFWSRVDRSDTSATAGIHRIDGQVAMEATAELRTP